MSTPTEFMTEVLAMWTETDESARRKVLDKRFTEDVHLHDHDGTVVGHAGLERFGAAFRARFPSARFTLVMAPQAVGDGFRASWALGPDETPNAVTGMDFVIWDGERARALYAFVNARLDAA